MTDTTSTMQTEQPKANSFVEHLVFVALLLPTFVVLAAAIVSLAVPDPDASVQKPMLTAAACACPGQDGDDGP